MNILVYGGMSKNGGVTKFILQNFGAIKNRHKKNYVRIRFVMDRTVNEQTDYMKKHDMPYVKFTPVRENLIKNIYEWKNYFKQYAKQIDLVYFNLDSLQEFWPIFFAKKYGVSRVCVHAHNSKHDLGILGNVLHCIGKKVVSNYADEFYACSEVAADWFYSGNNRKKVKMIRNGINVEKYKFSIQNRKKIRNELSIKEDALVFITVARVTNTKNQQFSIDTFQIIQRSLPNAVYLIVGDGPSLHFLQKKVKNEKIKNICFTGNRNDISELLSAADVFLFPSKFEGLPYALIEAQASGLITLASDAVSLEARINNNIFFIPLAKGAGFWAQKCIKVIDSVCDDKIRFSKRRDLAKNVEVKGFEIKDSAKLLNKYIFSED